MTPTPSAVTLIDLLVLLAIIRLLMGLLSPGRAVAALALKCQNNLKQIGPRFTIRDAINRFRRPVGDP